MTWRNGRELNTATVGGKTYSYEYDVNGLRTRKTNSDGGYTQYYIVDGLTVAEQRFTSTGAENFLCLLHKMRATTLSRRTRIAAPPQIITKQFSGWDTKSHSAEAGRPSTLKTAVKTKSRPKM